MSTSSAIRLSDSRDTWVEEQAEKSLAYDEAKNDQDLVKNKFDGLIHQKDGHIIDPADGHEVTVTDNSDLQLANVLRQRYSYDHYYEDAVVADEAKNNMLG